MVYVSHDNKEPLIERIESRHGIHTIEHAVEMGLGTMIGQALLPMHLPVLLVGLLAGPFAGLATGAFAPIVSFLLTGMPMAPMVPFMVIELAAYGLFAGLLRGVSLPAVVPEPLGWLGKLVAAQIGGRLVDALAIAVAVYLFGNAQMSVASVWTAVGAGLPGLVLQWVLIPIIMFTVERRREGRMGAHDERGRDRHEGGGRSTYGRNASRMIHREHVGDDARFERRRQTVRGHPTSLLMPLMPMA